MICSMSTLLLSPEFWLPELGVGGGGVSGDCCFGGGGTFAALQVIPERQLPDTLKSKDGKKRKQIQSIPNSPVYFSELV